MKIGSLNARNDPEQLREEDNPTLLIEHFRRRLHQRLQVLYSRHVREQLYLLVNFGRKDPGRTSTFDGMRAQLDCVQARERAARFFSAYLPQKTQLIFTLEIDQEVS